MQSLAGNSRFNYEEGTQILYTLVTKPRTHPEDHKHRVARLSSNRLVSSATPELCFTPSPP